MPRSRASRPLGDILEVLIDRMNIRDRLEEANVVDTWRQLIGPEARAVMAGSRVQGRKLFVTITSAARRQEMHLDRSRWRDRLNKQLGADRIDEIVFR